MDQRGLHHLEVVPCVAVRMMASISKYGGASQHIYIKSSGRGQQRIHDSAIFRDGMLTVECHGCGDEHFVIFFASEPHEADLVVAGEERARGFVYARAS